MNKCLLTPLEAFSCVGGQIFLVEKPSTSPQRPNERLVALAEAEEVGGKGQVRRRHVNQRRAAL